MYLSKNFTLTELIKSQTAVRLGIDNNPSSQQIFHLQNLCENVLQKIRDRFEKPVIVSSGFRSIELCQAIGSSSKSQHAKGQAADIEVLSVDNKVLADWIKNNLIYDQLILEFYKESDPQSGWIHVSYINDKPRKEALKAFKDKGKTRYFPWS
jgi:zinc D-Ala-D-Ala carboxypeptidase|tara:strand:- start:8689 stop:9147 length:459 start_codon:yes stop_codon:yes gene_type:complete